VPIREFAQAKLLTEDGKTVAAVRAVLTKSTNPSGRTEWHGALLPLTQEDASKLLLVDQQASYVIGTADGAEGKVVIKDRPAGASPESTSVRLEVLGNGEPPF